MRRRINNVQSVCESPAEDVCLKECDCAGQLGHIANFAPMITTILQFLDVIFRKRLPVLHVYVE